MNTKKFITEASIKIFSSMYSNSEADPCVKTSVDAAIELYNELKTRDLLDCSFK